MAKHGTKIGWTHIPGFKGETWNPITGCSHISPGCDHCYAERISKRFGWPWGKPIFHPERLDQPTHWKKPRAIFVCSMSDLFHEDVTDYQRDRIHAVMALNDRHIFLLLTKRPKNARRYYTEYPSMGSDGNINYFLTTEFAYETCAKWNLSGDSYNNIVGVDPTQATDKFVCEDNPPVEYPLRNVWLGTPFFFKQWGNWYPTEEIPPMMKGAFAGRLTHFFSDGTSMVKMKSARSRLLEGREWNEFPEVGKC